MVLLGNKQIQESFQVSNQTYIIYASCAERICSGLFTFCRGLRTKLTGYSMQLLFQKPTPWYSRFRCYKKKKALPV
jgi:hypothetical protein